MRLNINTVTALVGIVLGMAALWIGLYHVKEIKLVLKDTKDQLDKLKSLEAMKGAISTHYLTEFPGFMPEVIDLLRTACSSVLIFTDIPAYGQFSARHDWVRYSRAIEDLKDEVTLQLICLDHDRRVSFYHEFLQEKPWNEWKGEPKNRERLELLQKARPGSFEIESLDEETFIGLLEETNQSMIQGALARTKPVEIRAFMPVFFWLVDGTRAIFSIPALHEGHTEYGFSTTDKNLIDALCDMGDRYLRKTDGS